MTTKIKGTEGVEFPDSTVQATAAVFSNLFKTAVLYGLGGARSLGVSYTNNSNMPMFVNVTVDVVSAASISAEVNGITVLGNNGAAGAFVNVSFVVPAGGTYLVNTTAVAGSVFFWTEIV